MYTVHAGAAVVSPVPVNAPIDCRAERPRKYGVSHLQMVSPFRKLLLKNPTYRLQKEELGRLLGMSVLLNIYSKDQTSNWPRKPLDISDPSENQIDGAPSHVFRWLLAQQHSSAWVLGTDRWCLKELL